MHKTETVAPLSLTYILHVSIYYNLYGLHCGSSNLIALRLTLANQAMGVDLSIMASLTSLQIHVHAHHYARYRQVSTMFGIAGEGFFNSVKVLPGAESTVPKNRWHMCKLCVHHNSVLRYCCYYYYYYFLAHQDEACRR